MLRRAAVEIDAHDLMQVRVRDPKHTRREREPARLMETIVDAQRAQFAALAVQHLDTVVVAVGNENNPARIGGDPERILQARFGPGADAIPEFIEPAADRRLDARFIDVQPPYRRRRRVGDDELPPKHAERTRLRKTRAARDAIDEAELPAAGQHRDLLGHQVDAPDLMQARDRDVEIIADQCQITRRVHDRLVHGYLMRPHATRTPAPDQCFDAAVAERDDAYGMIPAIGNEQVVAPTREALR